MEFEMIAKTFQGLEGVLAQELTALGANNIEQGRRMVSFTGDKEMLYRANFSLRTAVRILKPIKHFRAKTADEVYDAVKQIDWSQYLSVNTTFAVDSVVYSNEFRHSKFVAYKVKDAIVDQFREKTGERPNIRITNPDMQLHIHVAEYDCTLSLDSCTSVDGDKPLWRLPSMRSWLPASSCRRDGMGNVIWWTPCVAVAHS